MVSMGQEFESSSARWFWLRVFHEVPVRYLLELLSWRLDLGLKVSHWRRLPQVAGQSVLAVGWGFQVLCTQASTQGSLSVLMSWSPTQMNGKNLCGYMVTEHSYRCHGGGAGDSRQGTVGRDKYGPPLGTEFRLMVDIFLVVKMGTI